MPKTNIKYTSQHIDNQSFNDTYQVAQSLPLEYDPAGAVKVKVTGNLAVKIVESGTTTYVGRAAIGSATSSAVWQVQKIDESSGTIVTWADGNDNFDNIFDNYASLSYS